MYENQPGPLRSESGTLGEGEVFFGFGLHPRTESFPLTVRLDPTRHGFPGVTGHGGEMVDPGNRVKMGAWGISVEEPNSVTRTTGEVRGGERTP